MPSTRPSEWGDRTPEWARAVPSGPLGWTLTLGDTSGIIHEVVVGGQGERQSLQDAEDALPGLHVVKVGDWGPGGDGWRVDVEEQSPSA